MRIFSKEIGARIEFSNSAILDDFSKQHNHQSTQKNHQFDDLFTPFL